MVWFHSRSKLAWRRVSFVSSSFVLDLAFGSFWVIMKSRINGYVTANGLFSARKERHFGTNKRHEELILHSC
jgi:hypothetical protein